MEKEGGKMNTLMGCAGWLFQFSHVVLSLGGLLVFSRDLAGSIVIDQATGKVVNYQDLGGGIGALLSSFLIAVFLWLFVVFIRSRVGEKAMIAAHFILVFGLKGWLIWSIYYSGQVDPRILLEFPLPAAGFLVDLLFLILAAVGFTMLSQPKETSRV